MGKSESPLENPLKLPSQSDTCARVYISYSRATQVGLNWGLKAYKQIYPRPEPPRNSY